jgi:hypothetical protein
MTVISPDNKPPPLLWQTSLVVAIGLLLSLLHMYMYMCFVVMYVLTFILKE